ncbi:MAG TPA: glycosyltransferase family 4 protein [Phototrophicaceae bacterium]|nr:glycosyltransferase family 4 protein [Phototrophicaceae bacterium]
MQRILYLTDSLMAGGTEQQLVELLTRLDRRRFEPHVVCLYGSQVGRSLHFLSSLRQMNIPVTLLDLGWSFIDKLTGVANITREVWRIRPQIVQAVNYHSNLLIRLARPLLPSAIRLVGCIYVEYTPKQLFYERLSSCLCAALICNSPTIESQLRTLVPAARLHRILNGIDLQRFTRNPDPLLRARIAPQARRILLFMGRVTQQKAPCLLIEAIGRLKQRDQLPIGTIIWIVGEVETAQPFEAAVRDSGLERIITCFPPTAQPEVFYHAADVVILPSLWEGLPNVMLESLASGRPVIASQAANSAGVVQPEANGWVFPTGDVEALAEVVHQALRLSDRELASMRTNCQQSVDAYAVEVMVQRYEALYDSLLSTRS